MATDKRVLLVLAPLLLLPLLQVAAQSPADVTSEATLVNANNATSGTEAGSVCWGVLGCFPISPPWRSPLRLVPAPDDPENINTTFFFFSREQNEGRGIVVKVLPKVALGGARFDPQRRSFFITHGLSSSSDASWVQDMKDALLDKMDANIFLTDWSQGAAGILQYKQAVANTRVVAKEMQKLIEYLTEEQRASKDRIHLIGHSLGAHISSYVGKAIRNISRITALDPAQPAFEGFDQQVRLDKSDADFVDVLHTDGKPLIPTFGLGMITSHGHSDYYVNGGFLQPGCLLPDPLPTLNSLDDFLDLPVSVISNIVSCPHTRAALVFTAAIRSSNCTFWGHPGNVVEKIVGAATRGYLHRYLTPSDKDCTEDTCSPLGLESPLYKARGDFVVPTTSSMPFCIKEPAVDRLMRGLLAAGNDARARAPAPTLPTLPLLPKLPKLTGR